MKHIKFISSLIALGILLFSCSLCKNTSDLGKEKEVKYVVSGTSGYVSITVSNGSGGTEQYNEVTSTWNKTYNMKSGHVYVSAQNQRDRGTVVVTIYIDGKQLKQSQCDGAYCIASASDWLN
jgi:hypothetical protein